MVNNKIRRILIKEINLNFKMPFMPLILASSANFNFAKMFCMKLLRLKLIALLFLTVIAGCTKETDPSSYVADEYYVKYKVNSSTIYSGGSLTVIFTNDKNITTLTIPQREDWEVIVGPVSKSFEANMRVIANGNTHDKLKLYTAIEVSKNGSPFALKAINGSDIPRNEVQIIYVIDY
jgi:hypothetical protein